MRIFALILCLTLSTPAVGDDVRAVSRAAHEAYQAKEWPAYLERARQLDALRPNHPRVLYNLAGAYALNGERADALETLSRVADMGLVYPASRDADFDSIRDEPRFAEILRAFESNGTETGSAEVAFTIDSVRGAVPEGVARSRRSGDAWVSLVRDRAIWKVDASGKASRIELPENVWSVTGLAFDEASGVLWFCTAATPLMKEHDGVKIGSSSVIAWDVESSELVGRWDLTPDDAPHWLGDLTLAADGTVYATDSRTPAIYRIRKGNPRVERWLVNDDFASLQGLALDGTHERLYVADYARGIWSIDIATRRTTLLPTPPNTTVLGIDGLYHHDGDLVAIQNGTNPHRIIRIHLDDDGLAVERVETLEANRPEFDEPTLGLIQDGWFWFVATSQWGAFADDGTMKEGAEAKPVVVMKRKL